jgi:hypothetical protein
VARDDRGPAIACQLLVYPPVAGAHDGDYMARERDAAEPTLTKRSMDYYYGAACNAPDWRWHRSQAACCRPGSRDRLAPPKPYRKRYDSRGNRHWIVLVECRTPRATTNETRDISWH